MVLHPLKCHKKMHIIVCNARVFFNCSDSAGQRGHGLDIQTIGHINTCNNHGRNTFFATRKIFARFCNQAPKVKYCHEFTKGYFSQSTLKEVIISLQPVIRSSTIGPTKEHYSFSHAILNNMILIDFMLQTLSYLQLQRNLAN